LGLEQQFAWRTGRNTPPWLCERVRDTGQPGLARMARTLVDSNRDLLDVLKMTEREFWSSDGADRGRRALFAELVASRFGPLSEAHRNAIEQALPGQLTAWAREVLSASTFDALLIEHLPRSDAESRLRGQRWLLWHELHALENATGIDIGAKIANGHHVLELPYWARRVLWESDVKQVFRVPCAQRCVVEGYIDGVRELLDSHPSRDARLVREVVQEELASAIAVRRGYA
jgi:hypothetical protein